MDDADRVTERAEHELQVNRYRPGATSPRRSPLANACFAASRLTNPARPCAGAGATPTAGIIGRKKIYEPRAQDPKIYYPTTRR